jgi:TolB-like protein/Flp pilus assembly protein TadD
MMAAMYRFGPFRLDPEVEVLFRGAEPIALGRRAVALLRVLLDQPGVLISKDALIEAAWSGLVVEESNLPVQIAALRRALEEVPGGDHRIDTLPRRGYRFVGPVAKEEDRRTALSAIEASPALVFPNKPSIAVLPFSNMSGDPEQDYFAEGMAEEIITALSRCSWLFVIARNSSFTYKDRAVDVRQVGRELGVRYVLEGSVRRAGDRLRFIGQLIDATSGAHIWADRFEGNMGDVFGLQDQFTENIVAAIGPQLQLAEIERMKHKPVAHLDAYDLLLRAQQLEYEYTRESLASAIENLRRALAIDPTYAPAMALGAYCYTERRQQGWADDLAAEGVEGARLAARAVEFGRDDGNVLWMSAYAVWILAMDTVRAHELVSRSLATNSNSAMALTLLAWIESCSGNPTRGLELFMRAERLSPRDPRSWFIAAGIANAHLVDGRFADAVIWAKKSLMHNPRYALGLRHLAASLAMQGDTDAAAAVVREILEIEPGLTLSDLHRRLMFMHERCWSRFSDGLRRAGLPE